MLEAVVLGADDREEVAARLNIVLSLWASANQGGVALSSRARGGS